jgi:hypothetical protein
VDICPLRTKTLDPDDEFGAYLNQLYDGGSHADYGDDFSHSWDDESRDKEIRIREME